MFTMLAAGTLNAIIIGGDFNADPTEPAYELLLDNGFRSCFATVHGGEPAITFPGVNRGLRARTKDNDPAGVFDFVFVAGEAVEVRRAALFADRPCGGDTTLYPSDHYGVVVDLLCPEKVCLPCSRKGKHGKARQAIRHAFAICLPCFFFLLPFLFPFILLRGVRLVASWI